VCRSLRTLTPLSASIALQYRGGMTPVARQLLTTCGDTPSSAASLVHVPGTATMSLNTLDLSMPNDKEILESSQETNPVSGEIRPMDPVYEIVSAELHRLGRNWAWLAAKLGTSAQVVSNWKGQRVPPVRYSAIAKIFG
jgi:hypothetical protein